MQYPVNTPGFENRQLLIETGGLWSGPKIWIDGGPAPKGPKRGQFLLRRNDGTEVIAQLRNINFLDPIPQIVINGKPIRVVEALKWYHWVWSGLPLLLVLIGGALGGLFGGIAIVVNSRVFRSNQSIFAKYLLTGIVSIIAGAVFFGAATVFNVAIRGFTFSSPQEFKSEAGGFSVVTPLTLKESVQSVDTELGKLDIHIFTAERGDTAFVVGYSDYPQEIIQLSDPDQMLDGGRDGAAANVNGKVIAEDKITLNNYLGRDLVINGIAENGQEMTIQAYMFLVENRLYQVMVVAPKGELNSSEAGNFLRSFRLLGQ